MDATATTALENSVTQKKNSVKSGDGFFFAGPYVSNSIKTSKINKKSNQLWNKNSVKTSNLYKHFEKKTRYNPVKSFLQKKKETKKKQRPSKNKKKTVRDCAFLFCFSFFRSFFYWRSPGW